MTIPFLPSQNLNLDYLVRLSMIEKDFREAFGDLENLQKAYDEVVRSIRILPSLFKFKFADEGDLVTSDLLATIASSSTQVRLKAALRIEGKPKLTTINTASPLHPLTLTDEAPTRGASITLDDNLVQAQGNTVILVVGYMYPHFAMYKDEGTGLTVAEYDLSWLEGIDEEEVFINAELVYMVMAKYKAYKALENRDHETFTYAEHVANTLINMYNQQREAMLTYTTALKEPISE